MDNMFQNIDSLISIDMKSEKNLKILSMESTFENCIELEYFNMIGFDTSNIISINKLFYKTNLKNFNLTSFLLNMNNLKEMSFIFASSALEYLYFSGINTINRVTNMSHMFYKCENLKAIDMSLIDLSNLEDISNMFDYCLSLNEVYLSNLNTKKLKNMSSIFNNCISLTYLNISNLDTSNVEDI